jgi:hypothetical protein
MHLQKDQNVKQCFDSKIAYIRCTGPNKQSMADELTDGLPVTYRDSFNPDASQTQTQSASLSTLGPEAKKVFAQHSLYKHCSDVSANAYWR